jgi:hypothetical protein
MNSIFMILDSLAYHEKVQLLQICSIRNNPKSKIYRLLQEFIEHPDAGDSAYSQKLYGSAPSPAFFQLKKRVKQEINELICALKNTSGTEESQERIFCTELYLQSQIFLNRGITDVGSKHLEKSLKAAIKADLPDLILSIFDTARKFNVDGVIQKKEIPELEMIIKSHLQILVTQYCEKKQAPFPKKSLLSPLLKHLNFEKNSWEILSKIRRAIVAREFSSANKLLTESENILRKDQHSNEIFEEFFLARQQILLQTGKFKEVIQNFKKVDLSKIHRKETTLELAEYQCYALFNQGKWDESLQVLKKNLNKWSPSNFPKWKYCEAYIRFEQKMFQPALKLIHESQHELKKYPDYYLGSKMLELMILFDQNDLDWLDYKTENFRKLISRWKGKVNARIECAFFVLIELMKNNSRVISSQNSRSSHFFNLQSSSGKYAWNPANFELIRYDKWLAAHFDRNQKLVN